MLTKFVPFLERKAVKIACERKTIRWATKLAIKRKKGKGKEKRARKKIEVDPLCAKNKKVV